VFSSCSPFGAHAASRLTGGGLDIECPTCMKVLTVPQSGSMAGTTASHNRAGQYLRNRRTPVNPVGTGRRGVIKAAFGGASSAWASLTVINQAGWTAYAAAHPITDSLGQSITLTGQQMFVSCATQLKNCGQAYPTLPPASSSVAGAGTPTLTAVHSGAITLTPAGLGASTDFQLVAFAGPVSGGVSFQKTFWQDTVVAGNSVVPIVATTSYTTQFGPIVAGQRVFYKVTPVNQYGVTGTPFIGFATVT
jgi:hypothetical protein